jgi:aldose 1-epimerase
MAGRGTAMSMDATSLTPPSGNQYEIGYGSSRAVVTQVGATLRSYRVDGRDVIDGFSIDERAVDGRGQVLAPWPNRLADGRYRYGDRHCQAPLNEPSRYGAIHGLVRWLDWSLVSHDSTSVTLSCAVRPQPGYEWRLGLQVTYALDRAGLAVTCHAMNVDTVRAPFGIGFHPYLTLGTNSIENLHLAVPANGYLISTGSADRPVMAEVDGTAWDFTRPRPIGSAELDTAYGGLVRGDDQLAIAALDDPAHGRSVQLWVDEAYRYLMVYTADQVGDPARRRRAVAVEPMTCPPNALRSGTDLIELNPGESWQGNWGLRIAGER